MYTGKKYELYDGSGKLIHSEDTRILEEEIKLKLSELDNEFTHKYHEKLGIVNKEKGDRKIQQARLGILDDKDEQKALLTKDAEIKAEYALRKELILNAKDCDEAHDAVHKHKKLVKKSKLFGLSSEYVLEDKENVEIE